VSASTVKIRQMAAKVIVRVTNSTTTHCEEISIHD